MEETNIEQPKITMAWSQIIMLSIVGGLVAYHFQSGNEMAYGLLLLVLVVFNGLALFHILGGFSGARNIAMGVLFNNPISIFGVRSIYPMAFHNIAKYIIYGGAALYVLQQGNPLVAIVTLLPHVLLFFLYNRILQWVGNEELQKYVLEQQEFLKQDERRNLIIQEELNKVMPEATKKIDIYA